MSIGIDHGLVGRGFHHGALVVQFKDGQLASLAIDDAQIAHDTGQQLWLTAVDEIINFAIGKLTNFALNRIKQMTRQVKPKGCFFLGELLFHTPRQHLHQLGLLGARAMGVIAHHVKQATLIGIGGCGCGEIKGPVNGRSQGGAIALQRIKGTCLDQGLHGAFVQATAVHAHQKIKQAGEEAALLARFHNGLNGLLASALDGAQTIANDFV